MGLLDALFQFTASGGKSLSGTADQVSDNVFDALTAKKLFGGSPAGRAKVAGYVTAIGGTSPTFRVRLVGADNAALSSNPIIIADSGASRVIVAGDLPMPWALIPSEQLDAKRYYGLIFTQGGTSPTATVVGGDLTMGFQDNLIK